MRKRISVGLVIFCLGLAGCGLFDRNGGKSSGSTKQPFTGLQSSQDPAPGPGGAGALANDLPPRVDGVISGQVLSKDTNRRLNNAYIRVVDLQNPNTERAALEIETDPNGWFIVKSLQKGRNYQLIARAREDGRFLSGIEVVRAPNPRVCITVEEDHGKPPGGNDPVFSPPTLPGQLPLGGTGSGPAPGAVLEPPVPASPPPVSTGPVGDNPANIAQNQDGFPTKPLTATIPNPGNGPRILPPTPGQPYPPPPPPPPPPGLQGTRADINWNDEPIQAPWCVLQGRQLKNLALYRVGLDATVWEYRRHHKGRVVLLDFWSTTCQPCLQTIPRLCDLQRDYGQYGLEVIGIAYETGTFPEQVQKVQSTRGRLLINYTTLLGGGGRGECPVKSQFQISRWPTLILLSQNNEVVWRETGLPSAEKLAELRNEITRQLQIRTPALP